MSKIGTKPGVFTADQEVFIGAAHPTEKPANVVFRCELVDATGKCENRCRHICSLSYCQPARG